MIPCHLGNILSTDDLVPSFFISIRHMHNHFQGKYRNPQGISHITERQWPLWILYYARYLSDIYGLSQSVDRWLCMSWGHQFQQPRRTLHVSPGEEAGGLLQQPFDTESAPRCPNGLVVGTGQLRAGEGVELRTDFLALRNLRSVADTLSVSHGKTLQKRSTLLSLKSVSVKPEFPWVWYKALLSPFPLNISGWGATWWWLFSPMLAE